MSEMLGKEADLLTAARRAAAEAPIHRPERELLLRLVEEVERLRASWSEHFDLLVACRKREDALVERCEGLERAAQEAIGLLAPLSYGRTHQVNQLLRAALSPTPTEASDG